MEYFTIGVSTFLGAAVALISARLTSMYDARVEEEAAINNLILDLAAKRAFLVDETWPLLDGEMSRIVDSISHARELMRDARLASRPRSKALAHLRRMTQACTSFLEASERKNDQNLKSAVNALTEELAMEIDQLHAWRPRRILNDRPGSFSLRPSQPVT
jgi:hypothetical protein